MAKLGTVIDGKYQILAKVASGGMSVVYLAMDTHLNKQWCIKEIRKTSSAQGNEIIIQSLIAEANLMKKLDHPRLPRIVDIIDTGRTIFVVMDYIEGFSLKKILDRDGPQPQEAVIEWAKQLCDVLEYLHTREPKIIYRDMKPSNVMLKPDNSVVLIDFGIAREYKEGKTEDTVSLGTKGYAAPEQFGGSGQTDERTDIYCLGATLYHLVTGHNPAEPPYEMYPIRHWNPGFSMGLERIIQKCTAKNPDERYQSAAELAYDLDHYEKLDDSYRAGQKKLLQKFAVTAAAALLSLCLGAGGLVGASALNLSTYDSKLQLAEVSVLYEDKRDLYLEAIDLRPDDTTAYLKLISLFKEDVTFTMAEQEILQRLINNHIIDYRGAEGYTELAFNIAKLYWYYYDYGADAGDNTLTRMQSAIQWFDDTVTYGGESSPYYTMAKVYSEIGRFNRDITLAILEADDSGKYAPYWENLESLYTLIAENETEIVVLEYCRMTVNAIETYARKFKADGISEERLLALCDGIDATVTALVTTTDKTDDMKNDIPERLASARETVSYAFSGSKEAER